MITSLLRSLWPNREVAVTTELCWPWHDTDTDTLPPANRSFDVARNFGIIYSYISKGPATCIYNWQTLFWTSKHIIWWVLMDQWTF